MSLKLYLTKLFAWNYLIWIPQIGLSANKSFVDTLMHSWNFFYLDEECRAIWQSKTCQPCVFPFSSFGKTYNQCTVDGKNFPWCATKVELDENYTSSNFGFCKTDCPMESISSILKLWLSMNFQLLLIMIFFRQLELYQKWWDKISTDLITIWDKLWGSKEGMPINQWRNSRVWIRERSRGLSGF